MIACSNTSSCCCVVVVVVWGKSGRRECEAKRWCESEFLAIMRLLERGHCNETKKTYSITKVGCSGEYSTFERTEEGEIKSSNPILNLQLVFHPPPTNAIDDWVVLDAIDCLCCNAGESQDECNNSWTNASHSSMVGGRGFSSR